MNILLKKPYGRRKKGEIVTVTNDKGREMIAEGIGTATNAPSHDDKPAPAPKELPQKPKTKPSKED